MYFPEHLQNQTSQRPIFISILHFLFSIAFCIGLHFLHININSLLPKIDELKCIDNKTKAANIGITESKLDHNVRDLEVNLPGYGILVHDGNKNG